MSSSRLYAVNHCWVPNHNSDTVDLQGIREIRHSGDLCSTYIGIETDMVRNIISTRYAAFVMIGKQDIVHLHQTRADVDRV